MADSPLTRAARRSVSLRWDGAVGALLVVVLLLSFGFVDGFGNALNLSFLIGNTLPIALIALPMTLIIITGEIDLSVASIMGLSSVLLGVFHDSGMSIPAVREHGQVAPHIGRVVVLGADSAHVGAGGVAEDQGHAQASSSMTVLPIRMAVPGPTGRARVTGSPST